MTPQPGDDALRACIADLTAGDPADDAAADVQRGDLDFFFEWGSEEPFVYAPGIAQCEIIGPVGNLKPGRRAYFDRFSGDSSGASDLRIACLKSIQNYKAAYNRAKATLRPESLKTNCVSGKGRIDPSYKPSDVDGFRREAEKTYGS